MTIDSKLVERIAKLSRISLTELEINNLSSELDNILNWIEQLSDCLLYTSDAADE